MPEEHRSPGSRRNSSLSPTKTNVLSKRAVWIVAPAVALIVAATGLGFHFFTGSGSWNAGSASAATFVGSETCAGCHRAEADLWRTSQHQHAMEHATDKSVLGDFSDATLRLLRREFALLSQGREISGRDRRAGRQARRCSR